MRPIASTLPCMATNEPEDAEKARRLRIISQRLRDQIKLRGWTQEALAEAAGVRQTQINRWARGKVEPSTPSLQKLARILGTSLDWFYEGLNEARPARRRKSSGPSIRLDAVLEEAGIPPDVRQRVMAALEGHGSDAPPATKLRIKKGHS
jgi:transcriptional regulator with XRE-family HTH domain